MQKNMDFNLEATNWDTEKREKRAGIIANEIQKRIALNNEQVAMEFGCGTGLVSFNLKDKLKHITMIDTSEGMIEVLNEKIKDSNASNMTAVAADINSGFQLNEKYDVIYTSMALHHITDIKTTIDNLFRLLKENGHLCIVDLTEDDGSFHKGEKEFDGHNGFEQNKLREILKEAGLKAVNSMVFYSDVKMVGDEKIDYSLFLMSGKK